MAAPSEFRNFFATPGAFVATAVPGSSGQVEVTFVGPGYVVK
jgi:hypothetical protein